VKEDQTVGFFHRSRKLSREESAWHALEILEREDFVAFLRAIRGTSGCIAVRLANEALDAGQTVDQLFFTGEEYGFLLDVSKGTQYELARGQEPFLREIETLEIKFGCLAGGLAGDGGQWVVAVTPDGTFDRVVSQEGGWRA